MQIHNRLIYHCLSCGSIKRAEPAETEPTCCGATMVKAAAETVSSGEGLKSQDKVKTSADHSTSAANDRREAKWPI
jgi:hypothetical protein